MERITLVLVMVILCCVASAGSVVEPFELSEYIPRGGVDTNDPSLPVPCSMGKYSAAPDAVVEYLGTDLWVVLDNLVTCAAGNEPIERTMFGPDEVATFIPRALGFLSFNGDPAMRWVATGLARTRTSARFGNTTGTFQTEMLSLNLIGARWGGS